MSTVFKVNTDKLLANENQPLDNFFADKQRRLLAEPLYSSWAGNGKPFIVAAGVGIGGDVHQQPIIPSLLLSVDVEMPENWWDKHHRSYLIWEFGKAPDLVIEILARKDEAEKSSSSENVAVSATKELKDGKDNSERMRRYARMGITYYVRFEPFAEAAHERLIIYGLELGRYVRRSEQILPGIGLGLQFWAGQYEQQEANWLRWSYENGNIIPTGQEKADQLKIEAEIAKERIDVLEAKFRGLGEDTPIPDEA